ncbi:MAG: 6-carboxytetrahydropterin synthase QueD [Armatimonadota bacterium]|nr:6-carboxytetrahydropterin synthase QueD [Armatimonadota bacterium]
MFELCVESQFDSAHNLRKYQGPCENLHGHTYKVQVCVRGKKLNEMGILLDFRRIKTALAEVVSYLDHRYLNELPEFQNQNPTAELIAKVVFEKMRLLLGESVYKVTIWESPTSSACYWEEA